MSNSHPSHHDIVETISVPDEMAPMTWQIGTPLTLELRGDGCVTWRNTR